MDPSTDEPLEPGEVGSLLFHLTWGELQAGQIIAWASLWPCRGSPPGGLAGKYPPLQDFSVPLFPKNKLAQAR